MTGHLLMLVGPPGSGKSTLAALLKERLGSDVSSTDQMRQEFPDYPESNLIHDVRELAVKLAKVGKLSTYDALNCTPRSRRMTLLMARHHQVHPITALVFNTPLDLCIERVAGRTTQLNSHTTLTPSVIKDYWSNLHQRPCDLREGFNHIITLNGSSLPESLYNELLHELHHLNLTPHPATG